MFNLLSTANPKTAKSLAKGFLTFILHLAPANLSGYEVCQWRTKGCTKACLNTAGHGGIMKAGETTNDVQRARIRRTRFLFEQRDAFFAALVYDIEHAIQYAAKHTDADGQPLKACFRLNGTSDLRWEAFPVTRNGQRFDNVFRAFPEVHFYDYTKAPITERQRLIPNYHLTFSLAETKANRLNAEQWYAEGHSIAAVFDTKKGQAFPATWQGKPVYDADLHDMRFMDEHGIQALRAKGQACHDESGFVNHV